MSSAVRASPTLSGGASCSCSASWTPSSSRRASETPDSRARHVHEALADVRAELEALFAKDASSTPTLPPLLCLDDFRVGDVLVHLLCGHHFCWACVQQWLKGSRGAPSVTPSWTPAATSTPTAAYRWSGASHAWEERDYGGKGAPIPPPLFSDIAAVISGG
jgi:hypothetical protein